MSKDVKRNTSEDAFPTTTGGGEHGLSQFPGGVGGKQNSDNRKAATWSAPSVSATGRDRPIDTKLNKHGRP